MRTSVSPSKDFNEETSHKFPNLSEFNKKSKEQKSSKGNGLVSFQKVSLLGERSKENLRCVWSVLWTNVFPDAENSAPVKWLYYLYNFFVWRVKLVVRRDKRLMSTLIIHKYNDLNRDSSYLLKINLKNGLYNSRTEYIT